MYRIISEAKYGRGLYADRNIYAGEAIMTCELLVLSEKDTITIRETELNYYTFVFNDKQDCLLLGDGELFNHSDEPNVKFKLKRYKDRMVMFFMCSKDMKAGDQLFIDYNSDIVVHIDEYIANQSLMRKT